MSDNENRTGDLVVTDTRPGGQDAATTEVVATEGTSVEMSLESSSTAAGQSTVQDSAPGARVRERLRLKVASDVLAHTSVEDVFESPEFHQPSASYVATSRNRIQELLDESDVLVLVGSQVGDEAKGKSALAFASDPRVTLSVRVNSGQNAECTLPILGAGPVSQVDLNSFPAGVLAGRALIGCECVMDPALVLGELQILRKYGVQSEVLLGNFHIVAPYHILQELALSPNSTGFGIAPAHASKASRRGVRYGDLLGDPTRLRLRLKADMELTLSPLQHLTVEELLLRTASGKANNNSSCIREYMDRSGMLRDFILAEDRVTYMVERFQRVAAELDLPCSNTAWVIEQELSAGGKVVAQGTQGYWLSNSVEACWENGTSANTTAAGLVASMGCNVTKWRIICANVARPLFTALGWHQFPSLLVSSDILYPNNSERDGLSLLALMDSWGDLDEPAARDAFFAGIKPSGLLAPGDASYQLLRATVLRYRLFTAGRQLPYSMSTFDCVMFAATMAAQGPHVMINCMDFLNDWEDVALVVAYVYSHDASISYGGKMYRTGVTVSPGDPFPPTSVLSRCRPVFQTMHGCKNDPIRVNTPLPHNASMFLSAITHYTGAHVFALGLGPDPEADWLFVTNRETTAAL